ncbi:CDP-glycerol glycerophosphotransferase family protein [Leuconostoc gasicomitatum]|uniref:CDP-glycerol glycerophosphotransferase family protein n=1 Tax=Leuconostoc gasicomitatum TaxID=115778 RepID=UPI001CC75830|nr:CDP-glycerol glycerophosphotransferase family protein [Leuconostoc gasicomitatum]MBZ5981202.1 CDP-glycerol glycerophosphotransferase family protein [Leuconostoc gasicomitatum]
MNLESQISGNLTVSDITKRNNNWSLKIKNNLKLDGNIFDLNTIENFTLRLLGQDAINDGEIDCEEDHLLLDIDLTKIASQNIKNDIIPVIGEIVTSQGIFTVEVLAWNGTVIREVLEENSIQRYGIGRTENNLFIAWVYDKTLMIENIDIVDYQMFVSLNKPVNTLITLVQSGSEIEIKPSANQLVFDLEPIDFNKTQTLTFNSESVLTFNLENKNQIFDIKGRAVTFNYDSLGRPQIDIDYRPILISNLEKIDNELLIDFSVPASFMQLDDDIVSNDLINIVISQKEDKFGMMPVNKISQNEHTINYHARISMDNMPFGIYDLKMVILNHKYSIMRSGVLRLGNIRNTFSDISFEHDVKIIEDSLRKNHPILIEHTTQLPQINDWQKNIRHTAQKRWAQDYTHYRESLPVVQNTILYESFFGAGLVDNPYAIFRYILQNDEHNQYTHIIIVNNINSQHLDRFRELENVIFVKYNSPEYKRWLAVSEFLIFNTSTAHYFAARDEQKVWQTWHGVPLKALGRDMKQTRGANRNVIRSFSQATLMTNPNMYTQERVVDTLDIGDIHKAQKILASYPRLERVQNAKSENYRENVLANTLKIDPTKKIVLYAPTWRGENGNYKDVAADYLKQIEIFKKYLPNNYQLLLKPHINAMKFIKRAPVEIVPSDLEVNEVLSVTDVLISDYSSIIFDFYFTGRPTINWMYDKETYAKSAGFYPEIFSELVWATDDEKQLAWMLNNLDNYQSNSMAFSDYNENELKKIVDVFFSETNKTVNNSLKTDLYIVYAKDFKKSPESLVSRIKNLQRNGNIVSLLHVGTYDKKDNGIFEKLPENIRNFYRIGEPDITMSEYVSVQKFMSHYLIENDDEQRISNFAKRELKREVGNISIHKVSALFGIKEDDYISTVFLSN